MRCHVVHDSRELASSLGMLGTLNVWKGRGKGGRKEGEEEGGSSPIFAGFNPSPKQRNFQNIPGAAVPMALPLSLLGVTGQAGPTDSVPKRLAYNGCCGGLCNRVKVVPVDVRIR